MQQRVWNGVLWPVSFHFLPSLLLLIQLVFRCCPTSSEQSFVAGHAESCWPESKLPCEELHSLVLALSSEQLTVFGFWKLENHCIAAKFLIAALSGPASCRTGPIRQLAGSDRSEHNLSRSDGQTSCLVSDRP